MDTRTPKVESKTPRTDAIDLRCLETIRDKTKGNYILNALTGKGDESEF